MTEHSQKYKGTDIAFIVPTKDRPEKMKNLLKSLAAQTESCGRVIVVASGMDIGDLVRSFSDLIPVEYHQCETPGQIHQRNMAISILNDSTPLVGSLDDDIVLDPGAVKAMVDFWNHAASDTGGVAFNIINNPPYRFSVLKALICMDKKQGSVLPSGYNVSTSPVKKDLKTDWLCGGATVWKQEIVKGYAHQPISSKWAICEDVLFSYPIGKRYSLYVCAAAQVRHEHVHDYNVKRNKFRYVGKTLSLWRLYFVRSNPELSLLLNIWLTIGQVSARLAAAVFTMNNEHVQYAIGQIEGLVKGIGAIIRRIDLKELLNDNTSSSM